MSTRIPGSKYQHGLDIAEIAKLVRLDIAAAIEARQLPEGKYSVKISRYSMGRSLDVRFVVASPDFRLFNAARLRAEHAAPYDAASTFPEEARERWSPEALAVIARLEALVAAHNYDTVDRLRQGFGGDCAPEGSWAQPKRRAEQAEALGLATTTLGEPAPAARPSALPTLPAPSERPVAPARPAQLDYLASLGVEA